MNEAFAFLLLTLGAIILWFGVAFIWLVEWDRFRQLHADQEFQPRTTIVINKRLVYEPKHSKHLYDQKRR